MEFFGIRSATDMFNKMDLEHKRFKADPTDGNLFNFCVTANHCKDYLEHTRAITLKILQDFSAEQDIKDGMDLCNKAKHHTLDRRENPNTWIFTGEIGGAEVGELEIGAGDKRVMHIGSRSIDVDRLVDRVMQKWRDFFTLHGLLPTPS